MGVTEAHALRNKAGPQVSSGNKGIQCCRLIRLVSPLGLAGKSPGLGGGEGLVQLAGMKARCGSRQVCWPSAVSVSSAGERVGQHRRHSDFVPGSS